MAIAINVLTSGQGTGNPVTASVTISTDALVLLAVSTYDVAANVISCSGLGLTWGDAQASVNWSSTSCLAVFRGMGTGTTGTITISNTQSVHSIWSLCEFTGVDATGGSAGAVVQKNRSFSSTSPYSTTLAAFGNVNNATYGFFAQEGSSAMTVGSGFTQIHSQADSQRRLLTEYKLANDTTVDASGGTPNFNSVGIEIKASGGGPPFDPSTSAIWMPQGPMEHPSPPRMVASGTVSTTRLP
jgi:hypothetical protein